MGIKMNMFAGNQMTAANDGMIYDKMIASSGILWGCEMTFMGANQIHIAKGYVIIKGRLCTILEETIQVEMANTDTDMPGRLYVHADLADAITPVKIMSVVADPLPALVQDADFNFDNGIYDLELGTYTAGRVAIKNFQATCETIDDMGGTKKEIAAINGNITSLSQKITSFESTKGEIANSALGKALGMLASWTWAQIVAALKAVANRGALNWSGNNTTYTIPAGYYSGGTLDSRVSYNNGYNAGVAAGKNSACKTYVVWDADTSGENRYQRTFNLTCIPGYGSLTADSIFFEMLPFEGISETSDEKDIYMTKSYNAQTGVLVVSFPRTAGSNSRIFSSITLRTPARVTVHPSQSISVTGVKSGDNIKFDVRGLSGYQSLNLNNIGIELGGFTRRRNYAMQFFLAAYTPSTGTLTISGVSVEESTTIISRPSRIFVRG